MFILRASEVVRVKADLLSCSMAMPAVDRERQEKDALSVGRTLRLGIAHVNPAQ
jgi:hypothetical protein